MALVCPEHVVDAIEIYPMQGDQKALLVLEHAEHPMVNECQDALVGSWLTIGRGMKPFTAVHAMGDPSNLTCSILERVFSLEASQGPHAMTVAFLGFQQEIQVC